MATITEILELKPYKTQWTIKVKIVKLWKSYMNGVESLEMVVVDEKNQKIHVTVKKDLIKKYQAFLDEGAARVISNFQMTHVGGRFRTSKNMYKINFAATTYVQRCDSFPEDINGLSFSTFADIRNGNLNSDYLIDVIGQVISIGEVEILNVNKKQAKKLTMEIRNSEDMRLEVVLWGSIAEQTQAYVQHNFGAVVVFVGQFCKLKQYKGVWNVGNCYNCSKAMMDPKIPEAIEFRTSLPNDGVTVKYVNPNQLVVFNSVSIRDDFFIHSPRRTISEIVLKTEAEKCVTMSTIMAINTEFSWYYMACKVCTKKVLPCAMEEFHSLDQKTSTTQLWRCSKCNDNVTDIVPRYMVSIRVMDNTGETNFILFDNVAVKLVNKSAAELTESVGEIENPEAIPLPLKNIIGNTFLFKIAIEQSNIVYQNDTYKVLSVITETDAVKEFSNLDSSQNTPLAKQLAFSEMSPGVDVTPSSKRKMHEEVGEAGSSDDKPLTKKFCFAGIENKPDISALVDDKPDTTGLVAVKIEKPDDSFAKKPHGKNALE